MGIASLQFDCIKETDVIVIDDHHDVTRERKRIYTCDAAYFYPCVRKKRLRIVLRVPVEEEDSGVLKEVEKMEK